MHLTRRTLIQSASTALLAQAPSSGGRPLGINLYTVRDLMAKEPGPTLEKLAAIGYKQVELRPANLEQWVGMLKSNGLQPVHMMIESALVTGNWAANEAFMARMAARNGTKAPAPPAKRPTLAQMIELAAKHRLSAIGISYASPEERAEPDGWERYAEQLNRAGLECKAAGLGLYHHNHSVELKGELNHRPIDRLARNTSRDVGFEIDIFWAAVGGADPATLIRSLKGRIFSFHLKDRAPGTPVSHELEDVKPEWFREIGEGDLKMPEIIQAVRESGARYWLVEQDFSKRDPLESARISYAALRKLGA